MSRSAYSLERYKFFRAAQVLSKRSRRSEIIAPSKIQNRAGSSDYIDLGFRLLLGVFRVEGFFAVAQDEDHADRGEQKRKDQNDYAHQKTAEGDVFGIRVGRAVKRPEGDDDKDQTQYKAENSQTKRDFPKHLFFPRFEIKIPQFLKGFKMIRKIFVNLSGK
jgi:hypothetical protein